MFYEKTAYEDDFPIHIRIGKVEEYPLHYHKDIEFVYVLKGEIKLTNGYCSYLLREGDIFTNSGTEVHGLYETGKDNVVTIIQINNRFFTQYFPTLQKTCYRTYAREDQYGKLDTLRKMLLRTLLDYVRKSFHYKTSCIDQMIRVIEYLNEHFNLFAFEDQIVVNFKSDNPVVTERISRIINYVYENHASRITLEHLAEREHLSSYYLSHLIKEYMGMNFREFLCFARVEMSAIHLLGTDKRISTIAQDVGFSTTYYYEKFFRKWFGLSPEAYRQTYLPMTLSPYRPCQMELLSSNIAVFFIKRCLSAVSAQEPSPVVVNRMQLDIYVNPQKAFGPEIDRRLSVMVTTEDFQVMGGALFSRLSELKAAEVQVCLSAGEAPERGEVLADKLRKRGYPVSVIRKTDSERRGFFGYDSIAAVVPVLGEQAFSGQLASCRLRDQGSRDVILKGTPACLTSGLIPKPSYYAYRLLSSVKGQLLSRDKYYSVIGNQRDGAFDCILIAFYFNGEIQRLCSWDAGLHETGDAICSFRDTLNLDFHLSLEAGRYMILKYSLSHENSIFHYMAQLGFPDQVCLEQEWTNLLCTQPYSHVQTEDIEGELNITFSIRGAGLQVALVRRMAKKEQGENEKS